MDRTGAGSTILLYHGSDEPVVRPDVAHNTGFADLGPGFYLTDDRSVARRRAASRARRKGAAEGVASTFAFDRAAVPWVTWGAQGLAMAEEPAGPFGLCFGQDVAGLAAWMHYIAACRRGRTMADGLGQPAVVRAWIATEEVELACTGMVDARELACLLDPDELLVQYCLLDQWLIDHALGFVASERVPAR